jgi:hypothetical protein
VPVTRRGNRRSGVAHTISPLSDVTRRANLVSVRTFRGARLGCSISEGNRWQVSTTLLRIRIPHRPSSGAVDSGALAALRGGSTSWRTSPGKPLPTCSPRAAHRQSATPRSASTRRQPSAASCVPGPTKRPDSQMPNNTVKSHFGETRRRSRSSVGRLARPAAPARCGLCSCVPPGAGAGFTMAPAGLRLLWVLRRALLETRTLLRHADAPNAGKPDSFGAVP